MRAFVAIDLEPPLLRALEASSTTFLDADPSWAGQRWVRPDHLHVTVHFIGGLAEADVGGLIADLRSAVATMQAFTLGLQRTRAVPRARRARMLWCTLHGDLETAASLERLVADACAPYEEAAAAPRRPYRPHVTLCRAREDRPVSGGALAAADSILLDSPSTSMSVRYVTLYSSVLSRRGPEYEELARIRLGAD